MKSRYDQKLVDELIKLEWEIGCITVGSKLSWPKPLPRRSTSEAKNKAAGRPCKKRPAPAA